MTEIKCKAYGVTQNGENVNQYIMQNSEGMTVSVIEYGAAITNIVLQSGRDVVLGYNDLQGYEQTNCGMGSVIGRYANRIENATYTINAHAYTLPKNEGENHLHGVFAKKVFTGKIVDDKVCLTYISPDGEDGFGGELTLNVEYSLAADNELIIKYTANTDKPTIINITNHSYFNLDGDGKNVFNHTLMLNSNFFCENNDKTCPTGNILSVRDTPMDFTSPKKIGADINAEFHQLKLAKGYDHNFVIDKKASELDLCAMAVSADGTITMQTYTTQPGVQLYTANFMGSDKIIGKNATQYSDYCAFCIETQHYPASPSHPHFPSTVLMPKEDFCETTIYKFITGDV